MSARLKLGVVGVGHLGQHHARIYRELPGVEFVGTFDTDPKKSQFPSLPALADAVDAVSVSTPTESHRDVARVIDAATEILLHAEIRWPRSFANGVAEFVIEIHQ